MYTPARIEQNTILRGVVGSTSLGTYITEYGDRDEMGVGIETPDCLLGLDHFEQYVFRTQPEGVPSNPGDLDLVIYSLRKYCKLAALGNPSIINLLYLQEYIICTDLGDNLLKLRDAFISREAGARFLGYLRGQKAKLNGERSPCVSRPKLVEAFGYDTKFAGHALRLGIQGIEYLTEGKLTLPMKEAPLIRDIRKGVYSLPSVLNMINNVEQKLIEIIITCKKEADLPAINKFLYNTYLTYWEMVNDV